MLFKNSQRTSLASNGSIGSLNSITSTPSWRSSNGSVVSAYTIPTLYSPPRTAPTSVRSSYRSSNAMSLVRPSSKVQIPVWKRLPQEVYECIFDQLEALHADPLSPSCATCYLRDLHSLALTSRGWDKAVRRKLCEHPRGSLGTRLIDAGIATSISWVTMHRASSRNTK
jgi:hypothetical protein